MYSSNIKAVASGVALSIMVVAGMVGAWATGVITGIAYTMKSTNNSESNTEEES